MDSLPQLRGVRRQLKSLMDQIDALTPEDLSSPEKVLNTISWIDGQLKAMGDTLSLLRTGSCAEIQSRFRPKAAVKTSRQECHQ